ncbi:MAG: Unknown protein [uncultured Sulfurovum sp.]|uniref:Pre-mRNA-splicing factor SYF1 central HAT repeats domain-containing protein n=1 Tax=uncultured Sulfurovum sp. TaxID=269237 RepID=A0A6S6U7B4_9BACT|nr:MAG: Unknown protein [uncultured Sulfurovum sp.]
MYKIETAVDEIMVNTFMKMGSKYNEQKEYVFSERSYQKALALRTKLANVNPRKHKPLLIDVFRALAELYESQGMYDFAIDKYREIITLSRILIRETQLVSYAILLAQTATKVANLHKEHHNKPLAQYFYTEALENYALAVEEEGYTYHQVSLLKIYLSLISLYEEESLFSHAEKYYKLALATCNFLIDRGLNEYNDELGKLHCDLASLYFFQANFRKAKKHYHTSLEILVNFKQKDSESYTESLAIVQNNLASIYATEKKYNKALIFYKRALPHLSSLAENNPTKYGYNVAVLFKNLASIYYHQKNIEKTEFFHFKSIEIFKEFTEYNEKKYNIELASCIIDGVEYYNQSTLTLYDAENILRQYKLHEEAEMLLGRIAKLRKNKIKERI